MKALEFESMLIPGGQIALPPEVADQIPPGEHLRVVVMWEPFSADLAWRSAGRRTFESAYCPEDAVYELPGNVVHHGRAAIRKIVTDLQESRARNDAAGKPSPSLYHAMFNHSIELMDATHAQHRCYAQTVRAAEGGQFVVGFMGRYEDYLVKQDGRWYIQSRKLVSFVQ